MPADETALPRIEEELESSLESARRLLDSLAQRLQIKRAARNAADSVQRAAHYVQGQSVKDLAAGVERFIRQRPGPALLIAVAAGFVVGRALSRK